MKGTNMTLRKYLYEVARATYRKSCDHSGEIELSDKDFGFFCGICWAISALELVDEHLDETVDDLFGFMDAEVSKRFVNALLHHVLAESRQRSK